MALDRFVVHVIYATRAAFTAAIGRIGLRRPLRRRVSDLMHRFSGIAWFHVSPSGFQQATRLDG